MRKVHRALILPPGDPAAGRYGWSVRPVPDAPGWVRVRVFRERRLWFTACCEVEAQPVGGVRGEGRPVTSGLIADMIRRWSALPPGAELGPYRLR